MRLDHAAHAPVQVFELEVVVDRLVVNVVVVVREEVVVGREVVVVV